jgi:hypothetical protein
MRQRLWNSLTLLSAVVCVPSLLLVGRSVVRYDWVGMPLGQNYVAAFSTDAQLWLTCVPKTLHLPFGKDYELEYRSFSAADARSELADSRQSMSGLPRLGIGWGTRGSSLRIVLLPLWLLPLLTAIPPVLWWRRRRRAGGGRGFEVLPPAGRAEEPGGR